MRDQLDNPINVGDTVCWPVVTIGRGQLRYGVVEVVNEHDRPDHFNDNFAPGLVIVNVKRRHRYDQKVRHKHPSELVVVRTPKT